jgi:cysteine synthase
MKYRFTLTKNTNRLILKVTVWDGYPLFSPGALITTQIVEDFTSRKYFSERMRDRFCDAEIRAVGEDWHFCWPYSEATLEKVILRLNRLASPEGYGKIGDNYTDFIGNTPLLKLTNLCAKCRATVLVKLECLEPNSVKDRAVFSIVEQAIKRGDIAEETEVIEASSGNVAFALSSILQVMLKKKPKIFISKMHEEAKRRAVRISGAKVVLTSPEEGTRSAKEASVAYAKDRTNVFQVDQHGNPDNARGHRFTTGPELYHQCHLLTGQPPAEFVTGLGSGGTAIGVAMFRDDTGADFKVIGVEPEEASLLTGGTFHAHKFSGLAPGFVTKLIEANLKRLDAVETVSWKEASHVCRRMLIEEGFLVGPSSGASIAVALRRAQLEENEGKVIVTIAHDRGDRYLGIGDLYIPPPEATEVDMDSSSLFSAL